MDETCLLWNSLGCELQAYLDAVRHGLPFPTDEYAIIFFVGYFNESNDFVASGGVVHHFDDMAKPDFALMDSGRLNKAAQDAYKKAGGIVPLYFVVYICHEQGGDKIIASKRILPFMLLYSEGETSLVRLDGKDKENLNGRFWRTALPFRVIGQ